MNLMQVCVNEALKVCLFRTMMHFDTIMDRIQPVIKQTLTELHQTVCCP